MVSKLVKFVLFATAIYTILAIPFVVFLLLGPVSILFYAFAMIVPLVGAVLLLRENRYQRITNAFR